jgi:hypothetical protein
MELVNLHPSFLKKDGKNQFVVLPYEEYVEIERLLEDHADLVELRTAKAEEAHLQGMSLEQAKRSLGLM